MTVFIHRGSVGALRVGGVEEEDWEELPLEVDMLPRNTDPLPNPRRERVNPSLPFLRGGEGGWEGVGLRMGVDRGREGLGGLFRGEGSLSHGLHELAQLPARAGLGSHGGCCNRLGHLCGIRGL